MAKKGQRWANNPERIRKNIIKYEALYIESLAKRVTTGSYYERVTKPRRLEERYWFSVFSSVASGKESPFVFESKRDENDISKTLASAMKDLEFGTEYHFDNSGNLVLTEASALYIYQHLKLLGFTPDEIKSRFDPICRAITTYGSDYLYQSYFDQPKNKNNYYQVISTRLQPKNKKQKKGV